MEIEKFWLNFLEFSRKLQHNAAKKPSNLQTAIFAATFREIKKKRKNAAKQRNIKKSYNFN